ncbi:MAG: hypothetical protein ACNA7H_12980 [Desulfotignum sp.]
MFLTVYQSLGIFIPLPHAGGILDAYAIILSDPSFFTSFWFSLGVALVSAAGSVAAGTFLAYRVWKLPKTLAGAALVYKIPLILPHIAVAFVVLVFWSRSGILASLAFHLGLIQSMQDFPNVLYSGWGVGMVLAYTLKGTPFAMLLILALLLTPALVPPMTLAMGLHVVFIKLALADTVAGVVLILALFSYPYMFRALVAVLALIFLLLPILLFFALDLSLMRTYRKKGMV